MLVCGFSFGWEILNVKLEEMIPALMALWYRHGWTELRAELSTVMQLRSLWVCSSLVLPCGDGGSLDKTESSGSPVMMGFRFVCFYRT